MGAELHLDHFERGRAHGQRTLDVARATGQGFLLPALLPALSACYEVLGRLEGSATLLEGGIEAARLSGNRQGLSLSLMNRSATARMAEGDVELHAVHRRRGVAARRRGHRHLATDRLRRLRATCARSCSRASRAARSSC